MIELLTEVKLLGMINAFTRDERKMPTKIRGPFSSLMQIQDFSSYMTPSRYVTACGELRIELDAEASDVYLT